jgi:Holliday junction resolvase-like predicted endonuclease
MDVSLLTTKEVGDMGEETVARALETRGHKIIDRNKVLKIGEIDIISRKGAVLHIIEVKTVLCDKFPESSDDATDAYSPCRKHPREEST